MKKTLLITGASIAAITLSTLTFAGVRNDLPSKADFAVLKTAIETNNYSSLPDTVKAKITEAQFAKAVEKMGTKSAVEAAITAGDYTAFRNAKIAEIPTEEEFKDMVAMHTAHTVAQTAIHAAIKNNDFAAFKKAHADLQASMVGLKPDFEAKTPDDTQLQKRFDALVAQYKKDGTLPEANGRGGMMMGMGHGTMKGGMDGEHMGKGGNRGRGSQE